MLFTCICFQETQLSNDYLFSPPSTLARLLENHEAKVWFLLRLGICSEFIGHGPFGVITKAAWLPYFAVWGIPENVAWKLMPIVGATDIVLAFMALFAPRKALLLYMALWGLMTACLRPLAGESPSVSYLSEPITTRYPVRRF